MSEKEFVIELEKLGISVSNEQLNKLEEYYNLLISYNEKVNLTRITLKEEVYLKHFYDSITLIKSIDLNKELSVCDVGTGAGFPGLVLKIIFPKLKITLVDALNKRIVFLNEVISKLELTNIVAIYERAEDFIRKNIEKYDLITCRAVSKLSIISELCIPGVKINGFFIPMKANIDDEILNTKYLEKLGGKIENIISFKLPNQEINRTLIIIKKLKASNNIYPRNYDKILKRPL